MRDNEDLRKLLLDARDFVDLLIGREHQRDSWSKRERDAFSLRERIDAALAEPPPEITALGFSPEVTGVLEEIRMDAAQAAFARGAETMREAAAVWAFDFQADPDLANSIRALPVPEDAP